MAMLYGRREACAAVDGLLAGARDSRGGALVVRGGPGIGKSALLEYAAGQAGAGWRVLRATGVESEAELPFAALHQLLRPVLGQLAALVPTQQAALRGALELGDAGAAAPVAAEQPVAAEKAAPPPRGGSWGGVALIGGAMLAAAAGAFS